MIATSQANATDSTTLTRHATARMAHRGIQPEVIEQVIEYGRTVYTRGAVVYAIGRKEVEWYRQEDIDLSDLFAGLRGHGQRGAGGANLQMPGEDFEVTAPISLEDAARGTLVELNLSVPEYDANGRLVRTARAFKARIPLGATHGQRLRLRGKGGKGFNGGRDGDLYLNIELKPHPVFRPAGHDLYIDLPLAPWEAALGATAAVPTLEGPVHLKVPAGTVAGQKLRLAKRGLPRPAGDPGVLFGIAQIVVPPTLTERERELFAELAKDSKFDPRSHLNTEAGHAH